MLDTGAAVELDAADLEMGNPSKGLSAGLGGGGGDWRLEIDSDLDIEPLAYVRTDDRFVASMHDLVREENMRYSVPVFNSGANLSELSRLRLINPGGAAAEVSISAIDDAGAASSGGGVQLTLPAEGARTLTAGQLEAGGSGLSGRLGTGTGKWRLVVTADRPILVMNLLANTTGRLGNLSTSSLRDNAPGSDAAFGSRFAGMTLAYTVDGETATLEVLEGGRFTDTVEVGGAPSTDAGGYGYERMGLNAGRLTLTYDDGDECLDNLYFTSTTSGWFTASCTGAATVSGNWNVIQSSEALPSFAVATIADQTYTAGTAIGALTLPEASGGDGTLSYSLSPSVPGLAFDAATRRLTGTPTAAGTHAMTYTVTDTDGDTDTLGFTITVEAMDDSEPGFDAATIADRAYTAGTAIGVLTLPEASGGDGTLAYSLSPSVPGLAFNAGTRRLTGTPTAAGTHAMTYTVTDDDGDSDTLGFTITVEEPDVETPGDCRVGLLVSPGGSCNYPGAPDAFSVDQDGRASFLVISSTLAINVNSVTFMGRFYDFRASHQGDGVWRIDRLAGSTTPTTGGGTDTDTSPAFTAMGGPGDQTYTLDTAIAALTLPAATGGDGTLSYSLSPSVPGLSFDAATRRLTGTPTAAGTHAMTYTVTDTDGDTDSLGFTITVQDGGVSGSPDLVVQSPSVSDASPEPGASVTFSATLRNQGAGESAATTLRYYRSTDATISTADTEVGTDAVSGLAASGTSDESIDLTTPSAAGTYYYGACVDLVSGESNTGNNCSGAVRITVSDSQSEIESFDLDPRLRSPDGITYADGRFYVVHRLDKKVYAYQMSWQRDSAFDFDLFGADSWATGIAYGNGKFHVVDQGYDKVYAYLPSGQRDSGSDFSLVAENDVANGLAYADDKLYVVGLGNDRKAYAYLTSGQRDSASDFNLSVDSSLLPHPSGVAYANGRFYVLEEHENKVYAYLPSGQRDSAYDFDLATGNNRAGGIAYANDKFYVVDKSSSKVYVYPDPAQEGGDGSEIRHEVGAEVTTLPTGVWTPDVTSGASFSFSDGNAVISFNSGGYIEEGGYRYTCAGTAGCEVSNRRVVSGTIVQTSTADMTEDTRPSFGTTTIADQAYTAGTAIDALTLPEAGGGDGTLVYSLSPSVPGLSFSAMTRRLTGTPTAAGTHAMAYTATDTDGDTDSTRFTITVQDGGVSGSPDLVVQSPSVSDTSPEPGASITFSATVRNLGAVRAAATTLRYYRSTDATISTADTELGADAVSGLAAAAASNESITLTAPSTAGTYYYGACVDPVSRESGTGNNCSSAVRVTVSDSPMAIESFDLDQNNDDPRAITFANDRFFVVDWRDDKVYAYHASGQRDAASDFDLDAGNGNSSGITYVNDRFYVVNWFDVKVDVYHASGQRDAASDFDLDPNNSHRSQITFANDRFYVAQGNQVFAYHASGQRDAASDFDFDLGPGNRRTDGIVFASDRFYVVNSPNNKVYAYHASGGRDAASDFDLDSNNGDARGITFANDRFYVVDRVDEKIYVYEGPMQAGGDADNDGVPDRDDPCPTDPDDACRRSSEPDLVVQSPSVSEASPGAGETFTFTSTVRNQGAVRSDATALRYHPSSNTAISASDRWISQYPVGALAASAASVESISVRGPSSAGTYYFGACVEPVSGETGTANNCSSAVRFTVNDSLFTIDRFDLDIDNDYPAGITFANDRLYVVNPGVHNRSGTDKVYAYLASGQRDSASDFDLNAGNGPSNGITFANDRLYVLNWFSDRVYAYHASGQRDAASDFDLARGRGGTHGITFANDRFYVVDWFDAKAYAYHASGQRDSASDFNLDPEVISPSGITFANDRFYVVDTNRDKIFAYHLSGQRDSTSDIELDPDNRAAVGIAYSNDRLYVVDDRYDKVYVYDGSTQAGGTDGFGTATIADQNYEASTAISPLTLPAASGGNGALTYALSPNVPGLTFNASTRQLTGTPSAAGTYAMTYTVMDDDGDVDSLSFTITVEARAGTSYLVGDVITTLPTGTWFPDVSAGGISFRISGGNAEIDFGNGGYIEEGDYRYTCASAGGCQIRGREVRAGVIVQTSTADTPEDVQPSFGTTTIADQAYTAGTAIGALTLPEASGGEGTLSYSLSPSVPGLAFDTATRRLTGTPTAAGTHAMTYTATDSDGDTDTLGFTITVAAMDDSEPSFGAATIADQAYTAGTAIDALTLPEASGGDGTLAYGLSPSVPGLSFDATTRRLAGTPTAAGTHAMTYTATDDDGDSDSLSFRITVEEEPDGVTPGDCQVGLLVSPGGSCNYPGASDAFSVDQDGRGSFLVISSTLAINVNNVTFMGRFYDFRASHQGDGVWRIDRLEGSTRPTTGGGTDTDTSPAFPAMGGPGDQTYTLDTAIAALTLPAATGGDGTLSYSLSPSVPGLSFDAATRQLTGTPTAAGTHAMTYRVTDDDGDTESLGFTITVQDGGVSGSPDLVVQSPSVSDASPEPGASVTFSATVRNQGDGESAATTLRYYRSTDATISTADTEVGRDAVSGLAASGASDESISLTLPASAGTYYLGACVDLVSGESNTGNNCSNAATVTVAGSDRIAPMDPQTFNSLMIGNRLTAETFFVDFVSDGRFIESGGIPGSYNYAGTDLDTGTLTLTYDRGNYGGTCAIQLTFVSSRSGSLSFTCESGLASQENWRVAEIGLLPGPGLAPRSGTDMVLDVTLVDRFEARETRAYDVQFRTKSPRGSWRLGCDTFTNNSSSSLTARLSSGIGNLQPGTVYQARYRYRNSSSCSSGSPAEWSDIGEGRTSGEVTLGFSDGESTTRSIPENSPSGINVGIPVAAVSADAVTYSLGGPDAGSFALDSETGQIRTTEGVTYDFEQKNRYAVTVGAQSESGGSDTIGVTILLSDLVPSCTLLSNVRINSGNTRLTVRWDSATETGGQVPVLGYETEIRRGDNGAWGQRRTILGRGIGATIYGDLVNGIGYQVRVRPINREGDCGWSIPVSGIPTEAHAPTDAEELIDRFDRQPVGSGDRNWRFLTPERCRHHRNGVTLDANCRYQNTGPDTGKIFLEFDDPSQGSCEISLAYSSLTAGSFIDECFDAGVNTNVPFDRSFRMPPLGPPPVNEIDAPRAPRTAEEFEVLAWGRDDFIPGLFFGCFSEFTEPGCTLGGGYRVERDPATGVRRYYTGDYTYENTGPSQGVLTFHADDGGSYTFTLDFEPSGHVRVTVTDSGGVVAEWPGMLGFGAQPILLPIPPSWPASIAIETDFAPEDWEGLEFGHSTVSDDPGPFRSTARALFGGLYRRVFERDYFQTFGVTANYKKLGRNRAAVTYHFWDDPKDSDNFDDFGKEVLGSTWTYELRFTLEGTAEYTLTITKDGHLPTVAEGVVDFLGDGININEFPDELLLPDDPPQASGEDRSGIEIAAAVSTSRIGPYDLQPFLLNNTGAQPISYSPGDWLEPKDGSNQRMMIVAANPVSAQGSGLFTAAIASFGGSAGLPNQSNANSTITQLSVVCMQQVGDIPKRGGRYFSQPKTAQGAIQECQRNCVSDQALSIQGCVWNCERTTEESASASVANEGFDDLTISQGIGALKGQESKGEIFSVPANTGRLSHLSESIEIEIGSRSSFFR